MLRLYDYQVNEQVLEINDNLSKLGPRTLGPYKIVQVHTNGTLSIHHNAFTTERISIRRVKPF
jgi:hypothetical protein